MTIDVRGSAIVVDGSGTPASTASSIVFASEIVGPVAANDVAARTLTVLGQTVDIAASTVFDESLAGGQAALVVGTVVEIYATLDVATGRYAATRVEAKPAGTTFSLRGIVSGLDTVARTFSFGSARISYPASRAVPSTLANGRFVRATLAAAPGRRRRPDRRRRCPTARRRSRTTTRPSSKAGSAPSPRPPRSASTARRSTRAAPASTTAATASRSAPGSRSRARSPAGVLVATRVKVEQRRRRRATRSSRSAAAIVSLDTVAKTFVVREVTVSYAGSVDFRDGTAADLAVGRNGRGAGHAHRRRHAAAGRADRVRRLSRSPELDRNSGQVTNLQHLRRPTSSGCAGRRRPLRPTARSSSFAKEFRCPCSTPSAAPPAPGTCAANVKAKAFARADANGDRSVDKAELQAAFDAVAAKTGKTARDAEAVIARIDRERRRRRHPARDPRPPARPAGRRHVDGRARRAAPTRTGALSAPSEAGSPGLACQ